MTQYVIYRNKSASKDRVPYLLDVQSNLLSDLGTRIVIPLYGIKYAKNMAMTTLTPEFEVEGKKFILMTPQMAGISVKDIGAEVVSAESRRYDILAAIDLLITGI